MTLDEAIKHCEEKAKELSNKAYSEYGKSMTEEEAYDCNECAREHEQLAKWLKELKAYKEASKGDLISREALYNEVDTWGCNDYDKYDFLDAIDNASTVEPDMEFAKWVTEMIFGNNEVEDFDFELFSELACRKLEKLGLVKKTESEWKKKGGKEE